MLITPLYLEWCSITTPNTRFEPHKYTVTMVLSDEDAQRFLAEGRKVNTNEDGEHRLTAKRSVSRFIKSYDEEGNPKLDLEGNEITTEKVNDVPFLLDADKQPMDVVVGNGSKGGVQVKSYPNKYGLQLELQGVMITDLVEYNPDENEIQF
tara:strand:+ start:1274 stop:1726 length:453 start_codon:yes stop_codon:yes gene_type:complete